jgi:RHS repeat-associated protein
MSAPTDVQWDNFSGLGLTYMHARHYSPLTGRFLQPDPSAAEANLYGYARNGPVTKVDPSGHFGWFVCAIPFVAPMCIKVSADVVIGIGTAFWLVFSVAGTVRGDTGLSRSSTTVWVYGTVTSMYTIMRKVAGLTIAMNSLHRHIRAGTAPWGPAGGFRRVDPPHVPGDAPHIHVNGGAIDLRTGRVRPGHPLKAPLTNKQREFLRKHGVPVP